MAKTFHLCHLTNVLTFFDEQSFFGTPLNYVATTWLCVFWYCSHARWNFAHCVSCSAYRELSDSLQTPGWSWTLSFRIDPQVTFTNETQNGSKLWENWIAFSAKLHLLQVVALILTISRFQSKGMNWVCSVDWWNLGEIVAPRLRLQSCGVKCAQLGPCLFQQFSLANPSRQQNLTVIRVLDPQVLFCKGNKWNWAQKCKWASLTRIVISCWRSCAKSKALWNPG